MHAARAHQGSRNHRNMQNGRLCDSQSAPTLMQGDLIRESIYINKSVPWKKRQGTGMYAGSAWQNLGLPTSGEDYSANFHRANVF